MVVLTGSAIRSWKVVAAGKSAGYVDDLLFNDRNWRVESIAVRRHTMWGNRWMLVARAWIGSIEPATVRFAVTCTRKEVRLGIASNPVQAELLLSSLPNVRRELVGGTFTPSTPGLNDARMRWAGNLIGYCVQSMDGEIGIIEDTLFDAASLRLRYLVVERWRHSPDTLSVIGVSQIDEIDDIQKKVWIRGVGIVDEEPNRSGSPDLREPREKGLRDATAGLLWSDRADPRRAAGRGLSHPAVPHSPPGSVDHRRIWARRSRERGGEKAR